MTKSRLFVLLLVILVIGLAGLCLWSLLLLPVLPDANRAEFLSGVLEILRSAIGALSSSVRNCGGLMTPEP